MSKNVKATIWASIAVMMLIIGGVTYERQRPKLLVVHEAVAVPKATTTTGQTATPTELTSTSVIVATSTATSTLPNKPVLIRKPKSKAPSVPSYGDMVVKYGGLRFQFGPECHAVPNQLATTNPVTVMLDNRSNAWQTITIGTHSYGVAPYNYVIATINETTLPINLFISCNQLKNTAQIILQR